MALLRSQGPRHPTSQLPYRLQEKTGAAPSPLAPTETSRRPSGQDVEKIYQPFSPVKSILSKNLKSTSHIECLEKEQGRRTQWSLGGCPEAGHWVLMDNQGGLQKSGDWEERRSCLPSMECLDRRSQGLEGARDE